MLPKQYPIAFEIAGDFGMFARPDSGSEAVSYPLPPKSAIKGMIESICRFCGVKLNIVAVATCSMPQWTNYSYNSKSTIRKTALVKTGASCQMVISALENPRFQILALAENDLNNVHPKFKEISSAHAFQYQFNRRLRKGQSFIPVSLGWSEMLATYIGYPVSEVETRFNTVLPSMVENVFNNNKVSVSTLKNVHVKDGVIEFIPNIANIQDGILSFIHDDYRAEVERYTKKGLMAC